MSALVDIQCKRSLYQTWVPFPAPGGPSKIPFTPVRSLPDLLALSTNSRRSLGFGCPLPPSALKNVLESADGAILEDHEQRSQGHV